MSLRAVDVTLHEDGTKARMCSREVCLGGTRCPLGSLGEGRVDESEQKQVAEVETRGKAGDHRPKRAGLWVLKGRAQP